MLLALRQRSATIRICAIGVALLLVPACKKPKWDPPSVPKVTKVEVVPGVIYAGHASDGVGTTFELTARLISPSERIIDINGYPSAMSIQWTSATPGLFQDATKNPVIIHVPNSPGTIINDIKATVTVKRGSVVEKVVNAVAGELHIAPLTGDGTSDWIRVEYIPDQPPVAIVLDAGHAGACMEDAALAVVQTAFLKRNLEPVSGCRPELALFSMSREMAFRDQVDHAWTVNVDDLTLDPLDTPNLRTVPVFVGLLGTQDVMLAQDEVKLLNQRLDRNRAGITIEMIAAFQHEQDFPLVVEDACETTFINAFLAAIDKDIEVDDDLFILFVPETDSDVLGYACPQALDQVGRVVYLSAAEYLPSTAAHEVGHVLSLIGPWVGNGGGHANAIGTFRQDNLMWNAIDWDIRLHQSRFSVGQIYRMNLHEKSFLTDMVWPGGPNPKKTRPCAPETDCPSLDKEPGQ